MEQKRNLNRFLITRFLLALVFIMVAEGVINLLYSNIVFPYYNTIFHANVILSQNPVLSFFMILKGCGYLILTSAVQYLPYKTGLPLRDITQQLAQTGMNKLFDKQLGTYSIWLAVAAGVLLVVMLIIYLLPYLLVTIFYSRTIVKEVRKLREADAKRQEEFNRSRNLLLSDVAHDLKTPITTISGYAQALNSGMVENPEKQGEYLAAIQNKSIQLSELITLLFEYVTLDSEGFQLKKEKANLTEFMLELLASQYADFEAAGMDLEIEIPETEAVTSVDKIQFSRAVTNLLVNAIRHNEPGTKVCVSMKQYGGTVQIGIADSGQPIDENIQKTMFEPFVLGDQSRSKKGSGLGLSISSRIVELHGGRLSLRQPAEEPYTKMFCVEMPMEE